MFDFGDELIIESYRIPWLIWIQLVVMLLLLVLLYSLSISPSDLSLNSSSAATAANAPSTSFAANRHPHLSSSSTATATATSFHRSKVGGKQINEAGPSTSRDVQRPKKENSQRIEDAAAGSSPMKDASHGLVFGESYHPCNFFGLAKQAVLKCLGLDSQSESSSPPGRKQGKKDD